jgi:hypothetical protein
MENQQENCMQMETAARCLLRSWSRFFRYIRRIRDYNGRDSEQVAGLDDADSLKAYAVHPSHVEVADTKVRPYTASRVCMDYEV